MTDLNPLTLTIERPAWQAFAECRGSDPVLFFADRGATNGPAKAICAACCVRDECLDTALANHENFGIFGGMSPKERRAEMRRRCISDIEHRHTSGPRSKACA